MSPKDLVKSERNTPQLPEGQLIWVPPGFMLSTEEPKPEPETHLWDYIWMLWRKKWLVIMLFLICVSLAALKNYNAVPVYEATAKLRIQPDEQKVISFEGDQMSVASSKQITDFRATQLQVLTGYKLAQQVMDKLKAAAPAMAPAAAPELESTSTLGGKFAGSKVGVALLGAMGKVGEVVGLSNPAPVKSAHAAAMTEKEVQEMTRQFRIKGFLRNLTVDQMPETEVITVKYMSSDPQYCVKVVNTLCDEYIRWTYESKDESFQYARQWLKEKLDEMKAKLEQSENDLIKLTGGQDFVASAEGQLPQQLEVYRQKIADAQRVLFEKQFELQRYTSRKNYNALHALNDQRLNVLLDAYAKNQIEYDKLTTQLGANSKEVRTLKAEMTGIEKQLQDAFDQTRSRAQFEYDQAKASLDYLQKGFDEEKNRITGVQKNMVQYNILKREVDVNRELYNALLQRWKEVGVTSGVKAGYASVIEPALLPMAPAFPNKLRTMLMGAMIGLFLGVGCVFFLDYMDTSIKDPEELLRITKLPILGYVGHCDFKRNKSESGLCVELMAHYRPRSEFAENIRSIRTSIQYSRAGTAPNTILVTSCLPDEGKTTIAVNLAIALASRGKKVLLVDADLKKPSLNKLFNVDRKLGLTEVLTGKFDGHNLPETEIKNLFVIPAGAKPPNPVELLDSDVMRQFLDCASNEYDHVVIDSAPSLNLSDASVLAPYVDGVMLVVQPGKTPREAVRLVKERLADVQGNILGLVVNNPAKGAQVRYGRRYGYDYGYGKKYGYGQDNGNGHSGRGGQEVLDISWAAKQTDANDQNG